MRTDVDGIIRTSRKEFPGSVRKAKLQMSGMVTTFWQKIIAFQQNEMVLKCEDKKE
jgi:hypothetical protein